MVTLFRNLLLLPMTTFLSITQKGPISLLSPNCASGSTTAKGCILFMFRYFVIPMFRYIVIPLYRYSDITLFRLLVLHNLCSKHGLANHLVTNEDITLHRRNTVTQGGEEVNLEQQGVARYDLLAELHAVDLHEVG